MLLFVFNLCECGHDLKHKVGDERADDISVATSVEDRSIDYDNRRAFVFGNDAPLVENFLVVSAESVDTLDDESIVIFEPSQKFSILQTVEVLSAQVVAEDDIKSEIL